MTDRWRLSPDGPRSQRIVLAAFKLSAAPALLGAVAWSIGAWSLGSVLFAVGSCVFAVCLLLGLIAERRERRRSS